jgi:hypothetical protein
MDRRGAQIRAGASHLPAEGVIKPHRATFAGVTAAVVIAAVARISG